MLRVKLRLQFLLEASFFFGADQLVFLRYLFFLDLDQRLYLLIDSHSELILVLGHKFVFLGLLRHFQLALHLFHLLIASSLQFLANLSSDFLPDFGLLLLSDAARYLFYQTFFKLDLQVLLHFELSLRAHFFKKPVSHFVIFQLVLELYFIRPQLNHLIALLLD